MVNRNDATKRKILKKHSVEPINFAPAASETGIKSAFRDGGTLFETRLIALDTT